METNTDVVDTIKLKPEAGFVKSLGAHHTFESAVADLVDNSIDAGATRISIRALTEDDRLVQVEVVDNGKGMDVDDIDSAMTLGRQRDYEPNDLGHFGIGLKSASFAHSNVLTVWSSKDASVPVGRRIRRAAFSQDFSCERLSPKVAAAVQRRRHSQVGGPRGTTVVWSELRSTYRGADVEEARAWMSQAEVNLRSHLGVTFHRLITKSKLEIDIVVDELDSADEAIGTPVRPVDPFGYASSGRSGYPKTIHAAADGEAVAIQCHIWPPKTDIPGFRIQGRSGERFQGFYIYRNDRLLQIGGWSNVASQSKQRQLARVVIDDGSAIGRLLSMNPEKAGLRFEPRFHDALARGTTTDGTTFNQYLVDAEDTFKTANKRVRKRHPVISPERGFAPLVRKEIANQSGLLKSGAVGVRWTSLPEGELFDIDFGASEILLNRRYRHLFAPNGGSLNDAPVVKALLFLLVHEMFEGSYLGPTDKDSIALWRAVLGSAVQVEGEMRG